MHLKYSICEKKKKKNYHYCLALPLNLNFVQSCFNVRQVMKQLLLDTGLPSTIIHLSCVESLVECVDSNNYGDYYWDNPSIFLFRDVMFSFTWPRRVIVGTVYSFAG